MPESTTNRFLSWGDKLWQPIFRHGNLSPVPKSEGPGPAGGVIGAFSLLAINWLVVRVLFRSKRLTRALEGCSTVLVRNGQIDKKALVRESLTHEELLDVIHKQGFEDFHKVHRCELEPNGTFYVEAFDPSAADKRHAELLARLDALSREVAALRVQPATE